MEKIRNFVSIGKDDFSGATFTGHNPRQAALKVANRSNGTKSRPIKIMLRERVTKKIYTYIGWTEVVNAPKNRPDWMPAKINAPHVESIKNDDYFLNVPKNNHKNDDEDFIIESRKGKMELVKVITHYKKCRN